MAGAARVSSGMSTTRDLTVNVIGWKPLADEPPELAPQFANPVPVRLYTIDGIRSSIAWLRRDGALIVATTELPSALATAALRCFCCTLREHDPRTHIERRRITSIDVCVVQTTMRGPR
jgi:hypothetical protein